MHDIVGSKRAAPWEAALLCCLLCTRKGDSCSASLRLVVFQSAKETDEASDQASQSADLARRSALADQSAQTSDQSSDQASESANLSASVTAKKLVFPIEFFVHHIAQFYVFAHSLIPPLSEGIVHSIQFLPNGIGRFIA